MNILTTKNGVNSLHPTNQEREKPNPGKENYCQLESKYYDLLETKHTMEQKKHPLSDGLNTQIKQLEERLKRNENTKEFYPVKDYLLEHSWLVKFQEKTAKGKSLNKAEAAKERRIYELREKVFFSIRKELAKYLYFNTAVQGDYHFVVKGWAEEKIWKLLISIGEPNHRRYRKEIESDYWAEV